MGKMTDFDPLAESARLSDPKFAGLIERHLKDYESIRKAGDGDLHTIGSPEEYFNKCAFVLTNSTLWAFRGRGMLGAKKPASIAIDEIEKIAITRLSLLEEPDEVGLTFRVGARTRKGGPSSFTSSAVARWQLKVPNCQSWCEAIAAATRRYSSD